MLSLKCLYFIYYFYIAKKLLINKQVEAINVLNRNDETSCSSLYSL